jgi:hypothetical protein
MDFIIIQRQDPVPIFYGQFNHGHAQSPFIIGTIKYYVFTLLPAQMANIAFPQAPAHGIHNIAFAAAIRSSNYINSGLQYQFGIIGEGFKAFNFNSL